MFTKHLNMKEASKEFTKERKEKEDYEKYNLCNLDCDVYLYKDSSYKRMALVFHFKGYFDLTIEGIIEINRITHKETYGLPGEPGCYIKLTELSIKCCPDDVINIASRNNELNGSQLQDLEQWIMYALTSLKLDGLVQKIVNEEPVEVCYPPEMEPRITICGTIAKQFTDFGEYANNKMGGVLEDFHLKSKPQKQKKVPVKLPIIPSGVVLSEYDSKTRLATVIRFTTDKKSGWSILFHFSGDDSFRIVKGVWHDVLCPSIEKIRPDDSTGSFFELGTTEISPVEIRKRASKNPLNGAKVEGEQERISLQTKWAKKMCEEMGSEVNWDSSTPWKYCPPPAYTVGPNRLIYKVPSVFKSSS